VSAPAVANRRQAPAPPPQQPPPQQQQQRIVTAPAVMPTAPAAQGEAARTAEPEAARPSPFVPPAKTPETARPPAPPAVVPHEVEPNVSVEMEPVSSSRMGKVVSHIPFLRRLNKPAQAFVPPAPVHQVKPRLSAHEREMLTEPVRVNVRVYVTEGGKVQYVELLSSARHNRDLATAAVYAARRWEFAPAHVGSEHVPGEVILHFQFVPPGPPAARAAR
jgi:TonB family protein